MRTEHLTIIIDRLSTIDPAICERDEIGAGLRDLHLLKNWCDAQLVKFTRRLDQLHAEGRSEPAASALIDDGNRSGAEAKDIEDRAGVCVEHPPLEDALESGAVPAGHLDLLARLTRRLTDVERSDLRSRMDEVTEWARTDYATEFERKVMRLLADIRRAHAPTSDADELDRQRAASEMQRWVDKATGMHITKLLMDPLRDAEFHAAIQQRLATLQQHQTGTNVSFGSLQIDAVLAAGTGTEGGGATRTPGVVVHVDARTLVHEGHHDGRCETQDGAPVPVGSVRRLCCDAVIAAVVIDHDGTTHRLGSELRTANREQRRALSAMYSTCAHPHCSMPFSSCRMHHVVWWSKGGRTVLQNLLPLCERHHHLVHEGGWDLHLDGSTRQVEWIQPDGRAWATSGPNRDTNQVAGTPDVTATRRTTDPPEVRRSGAHPPPRAVA